MEQENNIQQNIQKPTLSIPSAIVVGALIIAVGLYAGLSKNNSPIEKKIVDNNSPQQQQVAPVDIKKVSTEDDPYVGDPNAPVTIAYWFDYQCPFCKRFEQDTITQIVENYVKTGKVKVVFKDFQFLGEDSQNAGLASRAVWEVAPERFYEWHKAMFEKQDNENGGWGSKEDILKLTKGLGIDSVKAGQLMESNKEAYLKEMKSDKIEGGTFGINGTPGTIIGKTLITGAELYVVVKNDIEQELKK